MRTSGATISSASVRWIPIAASTAAFGLSKEAKKPSPVFLMTSPPLSTIRSRTSASWRSSSRRHFSSPSVSSSLVESTMSVKRNVRRVPYPAELLVRPCLVDLRAETLEGRERALELARRGLLVASPPERGAEQHARQRRLVRGADLLPFVAGAAQALDRAVPVLLGELDAAARDVHDRVECGSAPLADLVRVDDPLELVGRGARGLQVSGRDCDLDQSGKRAKPVERYFRPPRARA